MSVSPTGESDREAGTHGAVDPHDSGGGRYEAQPALYPRDSGVAIPEPDQKEASEWVAIAVLTRVRGIRGEFVAIPLSYHQERFENLGRVYLFGAGPEAAAREVEWVRTAGRSMLIKFHGIDS